VIADNTWTAMHGAQKAEIEWDLGPNAAYESEAYKKLLLDTPQTLQSDSQTTGRGCGSSPRRESS